MKRFLLSCFLIALFGLMLSGQDSKFEVFIKYTSVEIDTLTDGTVVTMYFSTDDAEQENEKMDKLDDDDLDAGWEGDPADQNILTVGLRFRDIELPQGATVDSAFLVMHCHESKAAEGVTILTITADASDDAGTFTMDSLITGRPMTTASVVWTIAEEWIIWRPYSSPDISAIIQEIVNRPGWAWGNSIAFILQGQNQGPSDVENAREFMSFENIQDPGDADPDGVQGDGKNHPDKVPKLVIYSAQVSAPGIYDKDPAFEVYPNPGNGVLNISLKSEGPARIEIFNLMGQRIRSVELTSNTGMLDAGDLQSGMYIFRAVQQGRMFTRKVVIK